MHCNRRGPSHGRQKQWASCTLPKGKDFPDFATILCDTQQNALCAKVLNMTDIMAIAANVVNSVRVGSLRHRSEECLRRRFFQTQLEENEAEYDDARWLSRELLLEIFQSLLPGIIQFLELFGERTSQLHDT